MGTQLQLNQNHECQSQIANRTLFDIIGNDYTVNTNKHIIAEKLNKLLKIHEIFTIKSKTHKS
jgi:hypothetical protein